MQDNKYTTVERIIAKIDNDFNPDNSDWIPRVGAWCIDAMSQLDVLRTKKKKIKLKVIDRIAHSSCELDNANFKIYDRNGCEIGEAGTDGCCSINDSSTGKGTSETSASITQQELTNIISHIHNNNAVYERVEAETVNDKTPYKWNVRIDKYRKSTANNYVLVGANKIELNFDTDYIYLETDMIETYCSTNYNCELPVIPNNGILIEAIAYYCVYKMLCRGYKHPVFNLQASQYGTNPYYIWTTLKDEARRSVIINGVDDSNPEHLFRSNFFLQTFDPKH